MPADGRTTCSPSSPDPAVGHGSDCSAPRLLAEIGWDSHVDAVSAAGALSAGALDSVFGFAAQILLLGGFLVLGLGTLYLPPTWGYVALRSLREDGFL